MAHERTDYTLVNLAAYYLLCLFAITFVVFMASTQSFILTDILGPRKKIVSFEIQRLQLPSKMVY